jgi:choline dehydrogenase-like flavoprotein
MTMYDGATHDIDEVADFVIVGSGAAGATCARWLAAAGRSVVVLEEGAPPVPGKGEGYDALGRLYRDAGAQLAVGLDAMPLLQGRCVGGSTVVSHAVQVPLPEAVWRQWVELDPRWADRLPWDALEQARERMDVELAVTKTPRELWGPSGSALLQGMPGQAAPTWRSAPGCQGSGRCMQGCPHRAKASMDVTLLPTAAQQGARIYARCRVDRIILEGGVAVGVQGHFGSGKVLKARAKRAVIIAASAIQTPWLLLSSGVRGVGDGFQCHPTATLAGLFHRSVEAPEATQAMESQAFRNEGVELASVRLPQSLRAAQVPGFGSALAQRLEALDQVVTWTAMVRAQARGRVRRGPFGPSVHYSPTPADRRKLLKGVATLAEAMLRAGALEVWPNVHGAPEIVTTVKQARDLSLAEPIAGVVPMTAAHFFGGVPVDDRFQVLGTQRLVVADSSLFPSNIGVQPVSAMTAVASLVAARWAD